MSYLLRKADVVGHFGNNYAAVGRAFTPPITKVAVRNWPEIIPELRARQLIDTYPELKELLLDPVTLLTAKETRLRLGALPDVQG